MHCFFVIALCFTSRRSQLRYVMSGDWPDVQACGVPALETRPARQLDAELGGELAAATRTRLPSGSGISSLLHQLAYADNLVLLCDRINNIISIL